MRQWSPSALLAPGETRRPLGRCAADLGASAVTEVTIEDTLPVGVSIDATEVAQGFCIVLPGDPEGTFFRVRCNLGTLPPGQSTTLTIYAAPHATGVITNTVSVSARETVMQCMVEVA
ncbi:MAG: hypothetical protein ACE5I7_08950 [Candidatus Binatia bacterium]